MTVTTSIGGAEISCSSYRIGKVNVTSIHAAQAIYPRLSIAADIGFWDVSAEEHSPQELKTTYQMVDITGELRLKEMQEVVAPVFWTGPKRFVSSSTRGHGEQILLACDLDYQRIEVIERARQGKAPVFYLQLWPVLIANGVRLDWAEVQPFQIKPTREAWLDFYGQVGGKLYDIIEVPFSAKEATRFSLSLGHLKQARAQILEGENDLAVEACRKAVEAMFHDLPALTVDETSESAGGQSPLRKYLTSKTDERRATAYATILSKAKELMNIRVHGLGAKMIYSRAEAQFIVRTTESIIALLGRLSSDS